MSDDSSNVIPIEFKRDDANLIGAAEWARELCKTYFREDPSLSEKAIDLKVSQFSDDQMKSLVAGVMIVIGELTTFFIEENEKGNHDR